MAELMTVRNRRRSSPVSDSSLSDFELNSPVEVDPLIVLSRGFLPYCFDASRQLVTFVRVPGNVRLAEAPFLYRAQYENAEEVVTLSVAEVLQLEFPGPPANISLVFATGRSGSTLISKIFEEIPVCHSLSEPDVFTGLSTGIFDGHRAEPRLLAAMVNHCHQPVDRTRTPNLTLKFRGSCSVLIEPMSRIFPEASLLFSYRNPKETVLSLITAFKPPSLASSPDELAQAVRSYALTWISGIRSYLAEKKKGIPIKAVKYEILLANRDRTLMELLRHSRLLSDENLQFAMSAFSGHSQAGTEVHERSRTNHELHRRTVEMIEKVFGEIGWTELNPVLPDTLGA